MRTVILIPCYNEGLTIKNVIEDFRHNMPNTDIYVYDNNSTDDTAVIAESAGAIVRHESRQGKGNVVRSMFREIDADCYIMVYGDDTYPASFDPILSVFRTTGVVLKIPTLIMVIGIWIVGVLMIFCGVILSAIHKRERAELERFFNMINLK